MNYLRALKEVENKLHQERARLQSILNQLAQIDDMIHERSNGISNDAMMLNNNFHVMQEILRLEEMKVDYRNYYQQMSESIARLEKKASIIEGRLKKDRHEIQREQDNRELAEIMELAIQKKWRS